MKGGVNIGIFSKLAGKKKKPAALVFVDYEHWYVSMFKRYGLRPRIREWRDALAADYDLREMLFFGDFSNQGMRYDIPRIREVSNLVIETQNTSAYYKKDFTDFIMLDYIYQKAMSSPDVGTFIIFTGDGHFSSVVKFLADKCDKKVIVYAVKDGLSGILKNVATETIELPTEADIEQVYYSMIAREIINATVPTAGKRIKYPTSSSVISAVGSNYRTEPELVRTMLDKMTEKGYISAQYKYFAGGKRLRTVTLNTEKLEEDNIKLITDPNMLIIASRQDKKTPDSDKG